MGSKDEDNTFFGIKRKFTDSQIKELAEKVAEGLINWKELTNDS